MILPCIYERLSITISEENKHFKLILISIPKNTHTFLIIYFQGQYLEFCHMDECVHLLLPSPVILFNRLIQ